MFEQATTHCRRSYRFFVVRPFRLTERNRPKAAAEIISNAASNLPRKNILTPLLTNSARRSRQSERCARIRKSRHRLSPGSTNCPSRREIPRSLHQVSSRVGGFCKIHRVAPKDAPVRGNTVDLIRLKQYELVR